MPARYCKLWRRTKRGGKKLTEANWLALHYGADFLAWHDAFISRLRAQAASGGGLTLLRGEPGTGKTTYVRYLVGRLWRTHRFYFLPTGAFGLLSSPSTLEFWLEEGKDHLGRTGRVVILEDAERLLMERGADNQDRLSNLLNLADGFLSDTLQLHIICTVNAALDRIDPALLRPGRLLASRTFARLTHTQAHALAQAEALPLPPAESGDRTYSLADLYSAAVVAPAGAISHPRHVGFQP